MTQSLVGSIGDRSRTMPDRIALEGDPYYSGVSLVNGTLAAGLVSSFFLPSYSRAFWAETLEISSNRQVDIQASIGGNYTSVARVWRNVLNPGVPLVVPVRMLLRPTTGAGATTACGGLTIRTALDATTTGTYLFGTLSGYSVYDDLNYGADKTVLIVGDSITNGTAGITAKNKSYDWLLRSRLRAAGSNVRVINKSLSGSTSTDQERIRTHGVFDFPQVDLIVYTMGANNATSDVSRDAFAADLAAFIAWKQSRYPKATLLVLGITPQENDTNEARAAVIRTAASSAVSSAADAKIKYLNLGTAFDRTAGTTVYATTDPAGTRIHPNDTGHAAIDTVIGTYLAANPITL